MGATDEFCLRWNDFESNISSAFRDLRTDSDFFDVSLVCKEALGGVESNDHRTLKAHKVILASCSSYFRSLLKEVNTSGSSQMPFIVMRGVSIQQLSGILDFMYYGEANVSQDDLDAFLALAEELQVKGLSQNQSNGANNAEAKKRPPPGPAPTPKSSAKRTKRTPSSSSSVKAEVPAIKSEADGDNAQSEFAEEPQESDTFFDETYGQDESVGAYDDPGEGTSSFVDKGLGQHIDDNLYQERLARLFKFDSATGIYYCTGCKHSSPHKWTIVNHVEAVHLQLKRYTCEYCDKVHYNKNAKTKHVKRYHGPELMRSVILGQPRRGNENM